jgi:hypothetical protein
MRESQDSEMTSSEEGSEKVYVTSAEILPGITSDNEVTIKVTGNLPTPAYKITKIDVKLSGTNIEITPIAYHNKDMVAIQMLVPFEETVKVKVRRFGSYTLKLNGRTDTVQKAVVINK